MISAFFVIKGKKWEDDKYCNVRNNRRENHDKKLRLLLSQIYMVTDNECLRGRDCKYWESLARLKKTRILIICLENPFQGDMFKKIILKFEKSNVSEEMGKNENSGFYLINYAKNTVKSTNFSVRVLKEDVW